MRPYSKVDSNIYRTGISGRSTASTRNATTVITSCCRIMSVWHCIGSGDISPCKTIRRLLPLYYMSACGSIGRQIEYQRCATTNSRSTGTNTTRHRSTSARRVDSNHSCSKTTSTNIVSYSRCT